MTKMLEVCRKPQKPPKITKEINDKWALKDIIITKYVLDEQVNEDGSVTIKKIPQNVNITKLVNEQKKVIKNFTAEEKLIELEKIFTK